MSLEEEILSAVLGGGQDQPQEQFQYPPLQPDYPPPPQANGGWVNPQPVGSWSNRPQMEIVPNSPANTAYQQSVRDILNPAGGTPYAELSARAAVDQMMQAQEQAKQKQQLELMQAIKGLDPQLQAAILQRSGIQVPNMQSKEDRELASNKQQALFKHQLEAPSRAANLSLRQQEIEDRRTGREAQQSTQNEILELRRQSVFAQQANQLQKLQDMVALIPPTDPRRKVIEEMILQATVSLLPNFLGAGAGGGGQGNPAPLEGPKITVRRKAEAK